MVRINKKRIVKLKNYSKIKGTGHGSDKLKSRKGVVNRMNTVVENIQVIRPTSFSDMIFDKQKRQETYDYYDNRYVETEEEKEIFKIMSSRRRKR